MSRWAWVGWGWLLLWSQEKVVAGQAEVEVLPGWSIERAQRQAYNLAILQALQEHFPTRIARSSKYILHNRTEGNNARTHTYFHLTADQYLAAEWLQTIETRYATRVQGNQVWVSCKVKGKARPRSAPMLPLEVRTLHCRDTARCSTTDFWAGDPFYLAFRSPVAGYLQIFWEDSAGVYRLLPYQHQRQYAWVVKADTSYLFFAPSAQRRSEAWHTDELILTAERPEVLHRVYLLFSPHPLGAPPEKFEPTLGFHMIDHAAFQEWLIDERLRLSDLQLRLIDISIRQK
ncbi:MAG: DUF4384 domain-containing protein [Bacteroidia bacterium]|nr:DUF4384 domain-containing protein [Bacteroidia bacterium]MDW8235450.1 hypothetical protein [Bacteroidia bacterium]